jgi:hypothetical protein
MAYLLLGSLFAVPLLILGLVALIRARPEDIPAVMQALALIITVSGPQADTGRRAVLWPLI